MNLNLSGNITGGMNSNINLYGEIPGNHLRECNSASNCSSCDMARIAIDYPYLNNGDLLIKINALSIQKILCRVCSNTVYDNYPFKQHRICKICYKAETYRTKEREIIDSLKFIGEDDRTCFTCHSTITACICPPKVALDNLAGTNGNI